jgi:hypothetical protein
MKKKVKLIGRAVRVPLSLTVDPADKRSSFGVIIDANKDEDWVRVKFGDGEIGDYQFNCLETLFPNKGLLYALSIQKGINRTDFITLSKVISLSIQGNQMEALKLAYSNLKIEQFCVTSMDNFYSMKEGLKKHLNIQG